MIPIDRQKQLLSYLESKPSASVRELSHALFVSEASVRRDVAALEKQGLVQRVYGGVLLSRYQNSSIPIHLRDADHSAVKDALARRAAALVRDGDTIFMDASSTVRRMLRFLGNRRDLKIVTHNLGLFSEPPQNGIQLFCTGGTYSPINHTLIGPSAEAYLRSVSADLLFFSSQAISEDGEISDSSEEETALRRIMIARSKRQYFLCDESKLGQRRTFSLCHVDDITAVLCNAPLPWEI